MFFPAGRCGLHSGERTGLAIPEPGPRKLDEPQVHRWVLRCRRGLQAYRGHRSARLLNRKMFGQPCAAARANGPLLALLCLQLRSVVGADPDPRSAGKGSVVHVHVSVQRGGLAGIELHSLPKRPAALATSVLRQKRIHRATDTSVMDCAGFPGIQVNNSTASCGGVTHRRGDRGSSDRSTCGDQHAGANSDQPMLYAHMSALPRGDSRPELPNGKIHES